MLFAAREADFAASKRCLSNAMREYRGFVPQVRARNQNRALRLDVGDLGGELVLHLGDHDLLLVAQLRSLLLRRIERLPIGRRLRDDDLGGRKCAESREALGTHLLGPVAGRKVVHAELVTEIGELDNTLIFVTADNGAITMASGTRTDSATGNVTYDAMLVDVAEKGELERVSALGFALGYLGGGLLFAVNVLMVLYPETFGLSGKSEAVRLAFLMERRYAPYSLRPALFT